MINNNFYGIGYCYKGSMNKYRFSMIEEMYKNKDEGIKKRKKTNERNKKLKKENIK